MRGSTVMLTAFATGLSFAAIAHGQDAGCSPAPPAEVVGPPLVAWSQLQQPVPVAQSSRQEGPGCRSQNSPAIEQIRSGVFEGTIARNGEQYALLMPGASPILVSQGEMAQRYQAKRVRITGTMDTRANLLYILSIN